LGDFLAFEGELSSQQVLEDERPKVPDVGIVMDGRPARVHLHSLARERPELRHLPAEGVVKDERHVEAARFKPCA